MSKSEPTAGVRCKPLTEERFAQIEADFQLFFMMSIKSSPKPPEPRVSEGFFLARRASRLPCFLDFARFLLLEVDEGIVETAFGVADDSVIFDFDNPRVCLGICGLSGE